MSIKLIDFQLAQQELARELKKLRADKFVTVGIHEDAGTHPSDGGGSISNAQLGAKLNFGDETNTLFGNPAPIPARPWLEPGVQSATADIIEVVAEGLSKGLATDQILNQVGGVAVGAVQEYMTELKEPKNRPYTIAKKGSDNPLIQDGHLRSSVDYKITSTKPEEGI